MGFWNWLTGKNKTPAGDAHDDLPLRRRRLSDAIWEAPPPKRKMVKKTDANGETRLVEQVFSNPDEGTEDDDKFYLQLGQAGALDLPLHVLQRAQRLSLLLYRKNVRAYATIELVKDFVIGRGITIEAADNNVKNLLEKHWSVNEWEEKLPERVRALAIFGEQLYPVTVRQDGLVWVSSVSPLRMVGLVRNPENAEDFVAARASLRPNANAGNGVIQYSDDEIKTFALIKPQPDEKLGVNEKALPSPVQVKRKAIAGQENATVPCNAFYFPVNRVAGGSRGVPDLSSAVDWHEGLDGFVFSLLERADISQDVVFDITYEDLKEPEIRKKIQAFGNALRSGGIYGHNEKVKLDIKSPNLGGSDAEDVVAILLRQIQSGTRLAGLYFGDSADLTRASASEVSIPVSKAIEGRQSFIKRMLTKILTYQIEQTVTAGGLKGVTDFSFDVIMPQILLRDVTMITRALNELGTSLEAAVHNEWMTSDEARKVYRKALEALGPVPSEEVMEGEEMNVDEKKIVEARARVAARTEEA